MTTTENRPAATGPDGAAAPVAGAGGARVDERQARKVAEAAREAEWRKPSFGKELFLGRLKLPLIAPWPRVDEAKAAKARPFYTAVEEFVSSSVDGAAIERDAHIPDEVFQGMARLGAFGMKIDEAYGGLGLSNLDYCRALMLVGSANPALSALISAHQSIGVPQPLKLFGTPEQ